MARTSTFKNKTALVAALTALSNGEAAVSRYLSLELETLGFVKRVPVKMSEGRGRPTMTVELTGKARGYLALAKNWKKKAA